MTALMNRVMFHCLSKPQSKQKLTLQVKQWCVGEELRFKELEAQFFRVMRKSFLFSVFLDFGFNLIKFKFCFEMRILSAGPG